jgi:hypothetical protein
MKIFEYIKKLDESGNYRLADKLDNEIRKIYAQAIMQSPLTSRQSPGMQENHALNPNFAFILNQLLMKEQAKMTQKKSDTDTLSPTKNTDIATLRKQVNNILSNQTIDRKKFKELENNFGAVGQLDSKIGALSETNDTQDQDITDNSNDINQNSEQIMQIEESVQTLKK